MESVQFKDNEVTYKKVYNYILANLPDYTSQIDSLVKFNHFNSTEDLDINKLILFSSKEKSPAILKALSAIFKDKIRIGFVS